MGRTQRWGYTLSPQGNDQVSIQIIYVQGVAPLKIRNTTTDNVQQEMKQNENNQHKRLLYTC